MLEQYNAAVAAAAPTTRAALSIVRRQHRSRLPSGDAEKQLPLHSKLVKTIDVEAARSRMRADVKSRFDAVFEQLLAGKTDGPDTEPQPSRHFSSADTDILVRDGVCDPVSDIDRARRPTRGTMKAFTVVELEKGRRRAIHWPEKQNAALGPEVYTPRVPLQHISAYLPVAHASWGAVLDLRCGFWQISIPQHARAAFRFCDAAGRVFEMKRLMMGHRSSVELMQILCSVIAGDPAVVLPKYTAPAGVHVWVDGICYFADDKANVAAALEQARVAADQLRATFKDPDFTPCREFDFIGVRWDLARHTVRLADKTRQQLPESCPATMTAQDVEKLVGRLIYAAGVTQTPLVEHYFVMKWAKRICHSINVGLRAVDDVVPVPASVRPLVDKWLQQARATIRPRSTNVAASAPSLFTDATLTNYGGVLITPEQRVLVTGAAFADAESPGIAVREAQAVLFCMQDFEQHLRSYKSVRVHIDNTTVEHSIRRGGARTDILATVIRDVLHNAKKWNVTIAVERVASIDNIADAPSRSAELDAKKLAAELAKRVPAYERLGAGRAFSLT